MAKNINIRHQNKHTELLASEVLIQLAICGLVKIINKEMINSVGMVYLSVLCFTFSEG